MKRLSSSDSMGGLIPICPDATEGNNPMYSREIETVVEEDCCLEESGRVYDKKRRLSIDQVKALEKNFELENKLDPERKLKLSQEIGLQPRQVAVWFQNRRARWKTKQLERDYGALKGHYDGLKLSFDRLQQDEESLLKEIQELKSKLDENGYVEDVITLNIGGDAAEAVIGKKGEVWPKYGDSKDGSSDSDSSAILNEESNGSPLGGMKESWSDEAQFVKIEEHNFFGDESCSTFFSDDQAPTLQWYCNDQWN